ncbi:MAG: glycerophosphodiester phosphodiesterase family protein [Mariprofundaceae bacterium]|nr:glycerophosphodiester phosphodiesterase family protein [Mariprofundaceae bacterium]
MPIKLIAHRGYAARFPENTIVGIEAAVEAGAQCVEVDVQLTADGAPVLFHDRTLDRMCGVEGAIADYSLQQIAGFSASEPDRFGDTFAETPIATLSELVKLIRRFPDIRFFIELKRISIRRHGADCMLEQTVRILKGLQQQCTLISFDTEILGMARLRGWRTGLVVEHWEEWSKWGQVLSKTGSGLESRKKGTVSLFRSEESKLSPFFPRPDPVLLFCDVEGLPPSGDLHLPDARLAVYEVADPEQARRLSARGVDFVETFAIGEMRAALA